MKYLLLVLCCILSFGSVQAQRNADCKKIKKGFFSYTDGQQTMIVYRTSKKQMEWSEDGVMYMDGTVKWRNDCTYNMTLENLKILKYNAGYSEEEAKEFEQTMKDIFKDAIFDAIVSNINSKGYTAQITILGEKDTFELKRMSKKKGKRKLKKLKEMLKKTNNENYNSN